MYGKLLWQEGNPGADATGKYFTMYCYFDGPQQNVLGKKGNLSGNELATSGKFAMEQGVYKIEK